MASIIKVDTIQTAAGGTPTAADLGINAISNYSEFRMTSSQTNNSTIADITANLTRVMTIGDAVTESSGVYTLPSTGYWQITGHFRAYTGTAAAKEMNLQLFVSTNSGSSYSKLVETIGSGYTQYAYSNGTITSVVDVTDVSTFRCKFTTECISQTIYVGTSSSNQTYFTFTKLSNT